MNEEREKKTKNGSFQKIANSIIKIEKYPDMASEGLGRAFIYITKVVSILAIIVCMGMMYQTYQMFREGIGYLQNEFPEFSYQEGILEVNSEQTIIISEEHSYVGRTIIDTKTEDEKIINQYMNEIEKVGNGMIVLKNKVILKNGTVAGTISYNYKELLEPIGIKQFTKQNVIDYINSPQIITVYVSAFLTIFAYSFMLYLLTTLSNAIFLSLFGYLATWFARIKIRYLAVFNMAIYALTLSIFLNMLYIAVNIFVDFKIEYFQVMYITVAAIYLVAAIFLLKTEFIKTQAELIKIAEEQEIIRKEMQEKEEQEKKEKEENEKKGKEDEKKQEENEKEEKKSQKKVGDNEEPQSSNA